MGKRSWDEFQSDFEEQAIPDPKNLGVGEVALSQLRDGAGSNAKTPGDNEGWEVAQSKKKSRKSQNRKKDKSSHGEKRQNQSPDEEKDEYPAIYHSPNFRLSSTVKLADLQGLILYLLADGPAPQWVAVRGRTKIRKAVVLMVPGLELGMFDGSIALGDTSSSEDSKEVKDVDGKTTEETLQKQKYQTRKPLSPDEYYPVDLDKSKLPEPLAPLAGLFNQVWPMQAPGDDRLSRLFSPMQALLLTPLPNSQGEKSRRHKGPQPPRYAKYWEDDPVHIKKLIAKPEELQEEKYIIHPSLYSALHESRAEEDPLPVANQGEEAGWVHSKVPVESIPTKAELSQELQSSKDLHSLGLKRPIQNPTTGRRVFALDCEMCLVEGGESELTRITLLDWDGKVVLDEMVKPKKPISDYLTKYSGITKEKLDPVTTTLSEIQMHLLNILTPEAIVVGHSLNSDFEALKMTHPFMVDTSICYPHPRGPPFKSSLKWLAQKYLSKSIQTSKQGHDPVEDALTALELVKLKCQKGLMYGTHDATVESLFKRLKRSPPSSSNGGSEKSGAVVDWGSPRRGYGASATVCVGCENDQEVVAGIGRAINGAIVDEEIPGAGVDFAWARFRELEAKRNFWDKSKTWDHEKLRTNAQGDSKSGTDREGGSGSEEFEGASLGAAVSQTVSKIKEVYESLPACTAFMVYSGTGDPRELSRLHKMRQKATKEYAVVNWDDLSVRWSNVEEQQMKKACRKARAGIGFVTVK